MKNIKKQTQTYWIGLITCQTQMSELMTRRNYPECSTEKQRDRKYKRDKRHGRQS